MAEALEVDNCQCAVGAKRAGNGSSRGLILQSTWWVVVQSRLGLPCVLRPATSFRSGKRRYSALSGQSPRTAHALDYQER
jgi:hypothetical protein